MNRDQHLLLKLMEECAEVQQRASKMMQFGRDEIQAGHALTNSQRLRLEIADLIAVMSMVEDAGLTTAFTREELEAHKAEKRRKIEKYLDLSVALGAVKL